MSVRHASLVIGLVMLCHPAVAQPPAAPPPPVSLTEARDLALRIVIGSSRSDYPNLRSNAIEAMEVMPDRALPLTQRGLGDPNPGVRFAAVVTAGKLDFKSLVPLLEPLRRDENPSVRAAAIYAMHHLDEVADLSPLGDMLESQDPSLRANVALILGLMGEPSAIPMLKSAAGAPMPRAGEAEAAVVRCQIAEAIVRLGDDSELNTLRAGVYNSFGEVRVISINALGAVGDKRMIPALEKLLDQTVTTPEPIEVRLAAAAAMARMGRESGLATLLNVWQDPNEIIRAQAAWGLGWFTDARSFPYLAAMLDDISPIVRVSAAASVLRRTAPGR